MVRPSIPAWMFDRPRPSPKVGNPYDCAICGGSVIGARSTVPRPTHAECIDEQREADAIVARIEAETVAAIVAEVIARRDRATKGRDDISFGREKALDDLLDWLGDWKRGGHG